MMISLFLLLLNYKNCGAYDKMNGEYFKNYISRKFPKLIKLADKSPSRLWIQDGDPCQNMQPKGHITLECGSNLLFIPARSPDINPIENLFNLVRRELDMQTGNFAKYHAGHVYEDFSSRVCKILNHVLRNVLINLYSQWINA